MEAGFLQSGHLNQPQRGCRMLSDLASEVGIALLLYSIGYKPVPKGDPVEESGTQTLPLNGRTKMCTHVLKPPQGFSSEGWLIAGLSDIPHGSHGGF